MPSSASSASSLRAMVDLPAPEGEESTNRTPRRLKPCGSLVMVSAMRAIGVPNRGASRHGSDGTGEKLVVGDRRGGADRRNLRAEYGAIADLPVRSRLLMGRQSPVAGEQPAIERLVQLQPRHPRLPVLRRRLAGAAQPAGGH